MSDELQMQILTERPVVRNDRVSEVDVVFEVRSNAGAVTTRSSKSLSLCLVIDRSGSMAGDKLETAKRSCADIHARLKPGDQLTVVTFDEAAQVVINPQTPNDSVPGKLAAILTGGNTNLSLGWYLGLLELQTHTTAQHHNRLFLLSDGRANAGETKRAILAQEAAKARELGITTTTIGIGDDFQEDLLEAIASESGGRFWYIKESRIEDILEEEFRGSLSVVVDRPRLAVKLPAGVTVSRELNSMSKISGRYRLRPIHGSDTLNFAVRLAFDPTQVANGTATLAATLFDGDREILSTQTEVGVTAPSNYVISPVNSLVKSVVQQHEVSLSNERVLNQMTTGTEFQLLKKMLLADVAGMRIARDALEAQRAVPPFDLVASAPTAAGAKSARRGRSESSDEEDCRVSSEVEYLEDEIARKESDLLVTELLAEFAPEPEVVVFKKVMRKMMMYDMHRLKVRANFYSPSDHAAHGELLAAAINLIDTLIGKFPDRKNALTAQQSKLRERLARYQ